MRQFFLSILLSLSVSLPCWAGASRNFTASSNNVDFGDPTIVDNVTAFSISFWAKFDDQTTGRVITKWGNLATAQCFDVETVSTNEIQLALIDQTEGGYCIKPTSVTDLTTGVWYSIVMTWAPTCTVVIYVNGVSQTLGAGTAQTVNNMNSTTANIQIGYESDEAVNPNAGSYAHFGIWTATLTASEAAELATGKTPPFIRPSSLKAYMPNWGDATELDLTQVMGTSGTVTGTTINSDGPPVFLTSPSAWRHWFDRVLDWLMPSVFADDIVVCNPTDPTVPGRVASYQRSTDPFKSGASTNPNSLIWSLPPSSVNPWDGIVPAVSQSYWKCVGNQVVAMSQAEQDAINAPAVAEAARQQIFADEINGTTGNDICHADLADITTKVNAWLAARQGELDAATTNAQVKASLRDQFYPAIAQAFLKVMKCVRAVQR